MVEHQHSLLYSTLDITRISGETQLFHSIWVTTISHLSFGLFGAPAAFQSLMDRILCTHNAYVSAYLDDIIYNIYNYQQRHLHHLRSYRCEGLTAKTQRKCAIRQEEVQYLGLLIPY